MVYEQVLQAALDAVRAAGADYADVRAEESLMESLHVRNGAVERLTNALDSGWGIHAMSGGGWGFASSSSSTSEAIRDTVARAIEIARASGTRRRSRSDLSVLPTEQGTYQTPLKRDPFSVPLNERIDLLTSAINNISAGGERVKVAYGHISLERHNKLFANTLERCAFTQLAQLASFYFAT